MRKLDTSNLVPPQTWIGRSSTTAWVGFGILGRPDIHIDVEHESRSGQSRGGGHPDARVLAFLADDFARRRCWLECNPVTVCWQGGKDHANKFEHGVAVIADLGTREVDVAGRTTRIQGHQQDPTLEHELIAQTAGSKSGKEGLQHVNLQELISVPSQCT